MGCSGGLVLGNSPVWLAHKHVKIEFRWPLIDSEKAYFI